LLFQIIPQKPNPREKYQKIVENLCNLLADKKGQFYRTDVFVLLTLTGNQYQRQARKFKLNHFKDCIEARRFLKNFRADVTALEIIRELSIIYSESNADEINNLRGAILEVFSYLICSKLFTLADKEVQIQIGKWSSSTPIDSAGCSNKKGCCFQGKASSEQWRSIEEQGRDLKQIESLTLGKALGAFITFESSIVFQQHLAARGLNQDDYRIFGRHQMVDFENACSLS
jgi:hypothetical protein